MNSEEQQFLNDLDKRLWNAADRLRSNVNPSDYMHVVLGLVFLKYVSDAFKERGTELQAAFVDPAHDYYLGPDAGELIEQELEACDYYVEKNVFWVPALARWDFVQANAKVARPQGKDAFHRCPQSRLLERPRAARLQARRRGQGGQHLPRVEARRAGGRGRLRQGCDAGGHPQA